MKRRHLHAALTDAPRGEILLGDALTQLRRLPSGSVDTIVTSPPYYLLRNYGTDDQLGLEGAVNEYVERLVATCMEMVRVLKPTGSLWFNLGDSYSRHDKFGAPPKSLLLVPERVALALTARGLVLRNKIVWAKPNPVPSSVADRLTAAHESLYVFVKQKDYYFNLDAIRVPHKGRGRGLQSSAETTTTKVGPTKYEGPNREWAGPLAGKNDGLTKARAEGRAGHPLGKNPGDVWWLATGGYRGAHFATFPERLITRPILAGCPARTCAACGSPWQHVSSRPIGPSCTCHADSQPGLVLDPYMGAGTTALVAQTHGRDWLGVELNPQYREIALDRIATSATPSSAAEKRGGANKKGTPHARTRTIGGVTGEAA